MVYRWLQFLVYQMFSGHCDLSYELGRHEAYSFGLSRFCTWRCPRAVKVFTFQFFCLRLGADKVVEM